MTPTFRPIRQVAAPVGRQTLLFGRDRQMAATGAKSATASWIHTAKRGTLQD